MVFGLFLFWLAWPSEEREVDAAILSVLREVGRAAEVVVLTVLQYEEGAGLQQAVCADELRQCGQLLQRVGRVGKDKVKLLFAAFDETKGIGP